MNNHVHPTIAAVLDTYTSGGSRNAQWNLDAEWRELREPLRNAVVLANAMVTGLAHLPRPLRAIEQETQSIAIAAFAEHLRDGLDDLLGDILGPLHARADAAGIDPKTYTVDRADFDAAVAKITGAAPRFPDVSCSQCGQSFGPGDSGFSHCSNHRHLKGKG